MHSRTLMFVALAGWTFAGCAKNETPSSDAAETAAETDAPPAPEETSAPEDTGSVQFNLPDGNAGSSSAQERLAEARQQPAGTAGATGAEIDQAQLIAYFPPFYPLPLRMEGVEGAIDVALHVDTSGTVSKVTVLGATAPEFQDYVVEAVEKWRFLPARRDGEPVAVIIRMTIPFVSEFGSDPEALLNSPLRGLAYLDGRYYSTNEAGKYVPANSDPVPLRRVVPAQPPDENWGKNLSVTLNLTVNEVGRVLDPSIHTSSGNAAFDQAALEAVRFWQFVPRLRDGNPVTSRAQLPILYGSDGTAG